MCSGARMRAQAGKGLRAGAENRHNLGRNFEACGDSRNVDGEGFKDGRLEASVCLRDAAPAMDTEVTRGWLLEG